MPRLRVSVSGLGLVVLLIAGPAFSGPLVKSVSKNPEAQKLIDQAWALSHTDSSAENYKQCYMLLEQADKLDPNNPDLLTDLSRYYWDYADKLPKQTKEQQAFNVGLYNQGLAAAEKSIALKQTTGATYWWAVNKSSSLEFSSIFAQAAAFLAIKKHADWVKAHEPDYYYGAEGRLWTEILSRVPKILVSMVGWNVQDSIDDINAAIKIEPKYLDNYLYKARFYWVYFQDKNQALEILDYELKQDPNSLPSEVTANKTSQHDARELWKKITGKDYPGR
jgi:tetratricopeptide (TPR) repeat protein